MLCLQRFAKIYLYFKTDGKRQTPVYGLCTTILKTMKFIQTMKFGLPVLGLSLLLLACDPGTRQEADRDFSDFSAWVNQNAERAPMLTEQEWNDLNEEFESRSAAMEADSEQWDEQMQQEWQEIKDRWAAAGEQVRKSENRVDAVDVDLDMDTVSRE